MFDPVSLRSSLGCAVSAPPSRARAFEHGAPDDRVPEGTVWVPDDRVVGLLDRPNPVTPMRELRKTRSALAAVDASAVTLELPRLS
jgi:hypothetical protein